MGNDRFRTDAIDNDQLLAAGGPGDDPHVSAGDAQLIGQEPDEGGVGGALDGRGHDVDLQDAVDDVDEFDSRARGEANGEANVREAQDLRRRATGSPIRSER